MQQMHICTKKSNRLHWQCTKVFLRLSSKKSPIAFHYHMEYAPIRQVSRMKYLGVAIADNLSWSKHVQMITYKARQVNNFIYRNCPPHIKCVVAIGSWFVPSLNMLLLSGIHTPYPT